MASNDGRLAAGLRIRQTVRNIFGGQRLVHVERRRNIPCALPQDERRVSHSGTTEAPDGSRERRVLMLAEDRLRSHLGQ